MQSASRAIEIAMELRALREKRGYKTQVDFAKYAKMQQSAISRIESGQHKTSVETLQRLAAALEVRFVVGFASGPAERPVRELVEI